MYLRPAPPRDPYAGQMTDIADVLPSPLVREILADGERKKERVELLEEDQWDVESPREGTEEERRRELKDWHEKI